MVEKWQCGFCLDTKGWRFNVFNLLLHRNCKNVGDVGWLLVILYIYYCHNGSFPQPEGKPRAALSTSGNVAKSLFILSSISLFGDMMSRKYLMMHISKYTFKGSVGKVIQGRDILIGMVARIENTLFHTRAWWQHEFLVTVIMVSQDSKGATCKPNGCAIHFFIFLFLMLLKFRI